tara:strand:- start:443 stop:973 length:531 start_codon:yes stop_codon:yes gene_type:complete
MWKISKSFDFCYGHKVHLQQLIEEYSLTTQCKCRHLHGHQGQLIVSLVGEKLNEQGMVFDFVNLNFIKKFLDDVLDHKFIIDSSDPVIDILIPKYGGLTLPRISDEKGYSLIDVQNVKEEELIDLYTSFVIVPFIPTSEKISEWLFNIISDILKPLCKVESVQFFETPKSQSIYTG